MAGVIAEIDIAAPPEAVWALLEDPNRYPEIADPTERMLEVPDGPMGVGSIYKERGGIPPFISESTWKVTAWDPPTHTVHVGDDGQVEFHLTVDITPREGACRYRQQLSMKPRWWLTVPMAVLWPLMMRKRAQAAMDKTVANIKRIAEAEAGAGS